jgi:chromatin remodeling complex protein RSC6
MEESFQSITRNEHDTKEKENESESDLDVNQTDILRSEVKGDCVNKFQIKLFDYNVKINIILKELKSIKILGNSLEKEFATVMKNLSKASKKRYSSSNTRVLSGFAVPTLISKELCEFLNLKPDEYYERKEITKSINLYIKENNCRDTVDRRNIVPDEKLKRIFGAGPNDKITYFNLQSYMKRHYIKKV